MKKCITGIVAFLLAASMFFAAAPVAFAGDDTTTAPNAGLSLEAPGVLSEDLRPVQDREHGQGLSLEEGGDRGNDAGREGNAESSASGSAGASVDVGGSAGASVDVDADGTDDANANDNSDDESVVDGEEAESGENGERDEGDEAGETGDGDPSWPPSQDDDNPLDDASVCSELCRLLHELRNSLKSQEEIPIACLDSTFISETKLIVGFYPANDTDGAANQTALINKINEFLVYWGLSDGAEAPSFPLVVVGSLPKGFAFIDNTLVLTDTSLLSWSSSAGDEQDALTRSYEITLGLRSGISFLDARLCRMGTPYLAVETFTIDLQLRNHPPDDSHGGGSHDGEDDTLPDVPSDGTTDGGPAIIITNPAGTTYPGSAQLTRAEDPSAAGEAQAALTNDPAEHAAAAATANPAASTPSAQAPTTNLAEQQVPTASFMTDGNNNSIAANVGLASLSLITSVASLAALRTRKPRVKTAHTAVALSPFCQTVGLVSIGLGAINVVLMALSQCQSSPLYSDTIAWTPFLTTVTIVQMACAATLFVSMRRSAVKEVGKPRYKIRY